VGGRWVDHPFLPYIGRPNADYTLENTGPGGERLSEHIANNAYGYRSTPFPERKEPGDFHIVCLGGSTTYGRGAASNSQTWPELLERRLAERYPDRRFRAFNLGLDRANITVNVVSLALVGAHLEPDLVITYEGYNDIAALGGDDFRTDNAHFYRNLNAAGLRPAFVVALPRPLDRSLALSWLARGLDVFTGRNDLSDRITRVRGPGSDPLHGIDATLENLRTIHSIATGNGARALFATFQFRDDDPVSERFNDRLREFFRENDLDYVDQAALIPNGDATINSDICHFTPKGQGLLVDNFFDYIVEHGLVSTSDAAR
jgi:lysophospholipase L1-like esterase